MNTRLARLKLLAALCSAAAVTTASYGQGEHLWLGTNSNPYDLSAAANWSNGLPTAANGDLAVFAGIAPGNLNLTNAGNLGPFGIAWSMTTTPSQTGSIWFHPPSTGNSGTWRFNDFTNAAGAGSVTFGESNANRNLDWILGTSPRTHVFLNDSVNDCVFNFVQLRNGGAGFHPMHFTGTGNWIVNNRLRANNNAAITLWKDGPGTLTWSAGEFNLFNSPLASPVTVSNGTLILKSHDLITSQGIVHVGNLLKYDSSAGAGLFTGVISGTGPVEMTSGQLTLSGNNTYTGNTTLTGGTLILGANDSILTIIDTNLLTTNITYRGPLGGTNGTIALNGGTLQHSAANAVDYSSRFSTAAGQQYNINTGGRIVTYATGLSSSGGSLVKSGSGTLVLSGTSSYAGLTTVNAGSLVFLGSKTGTGAITVADGADLGVTATGSAMTPSSLTLGSSSGSAVSFYNISSTTTAPLQASSITSSGTQTINIFSGSFAVGNSYPLMTWTGAAPTFAKGLILGVDGNLSVTGGNTLIFTVTEVGYTWTGGGGANWDTTTAGSWTFGGAPATFANNAITLFDDTATGETNVVLNAAVTPKNVTFYNSAKTYTLTSSGANVIGGTSTLTKLNNGTLTLSGGVNSYSGPTIAGGGTLSVSALANGGAASDIGGSSSASSNLVLNGGALEYTGNDANIDRLFTLGTGNGTITANTSNALVLNNPGAIGLSGVGTHTLTLAGSGTNNNILAASLEDGTGASSLAKSGGGKWIVTGTNNYTGGTTIVGGTLQVGNGGAVGSLGSGNVSLVGTLAYNRTGAVTNGTISGTGSVRVEGGTVVLPGNNTYTGTTTVSNGATLQVGVGGATGSLNGGSAINNAGLLIFDTAGEFNYLGGGAINGEGNLVMRGSGLVKIIGNNTYTGWTLIEPGATLQPCEGNTGTFVSSVVTNNGSLKLVRQDTAVFIYSNNIVGTGRVWKDVNNFNFGDVTLLGTNSYSGGTYIAGGSIVLGDGFTPGSGTIIGDVVFTNSVIDNNVAREIAFNRPDDFTFAGNIVNAVTGAATANSGRLVVNGFGSMTLVGNNTYIGGTTINAGRLIVGNGGTSGSIGTGPVTLGGSGTLVWDRSDSQTFAPAITGGGVFIKSGAGTLTLTANNQIGLTTVSNGTLIINGSNSLANTYVYANGTLGGTGTVNGAVYLYDTGTTLAPGLPDEVGTFTVNDGDVNLAGNMRIKINKASSKTNDMVAQTGFFNGVYYNNFGGNSITVTNIGPDLAVNDKFYLFSTNVYQGNLLTVTGAGATWSNNLAVDGSIIALTVPPPSVNLNPPVLQVSQSGNTLNLAWPTNKGWTLQTNAVGLTASGQWFAYPGSQVLTNLNITINPALTNVFFRMVYP